jgi:hypothetical protein
LKIYSANLAHSIKLQAQAGECRQLRELDLNQTSDQGKAKENKKRMRETKVKVSISSTTRG